MANGKKNGNGHRKNTKVWSVYGIRALASTFNNFGYGSAINYAMDGDWRRALQMLSNPIGQQNKSQVMRDVGTYIGGKRFIGPVKIPTPGKITVQFF